VDPDRRHRHHGVVLGVDRQDRDAQLAQPRGDAGASVVVGGAGEAVPRRHDPLVPLEEGADALRRGDGDRHRTTALGMALRHLTVDVLEMRHHVAAVERGSRPVDGPLAGGEIDRRADRGHRRHPRVPRLGGVAQGRVAAERVAGDGDGDEPRQVGRRQCRVEIGGEAAVIEVLAPAVGPPER
jgi:hypothetical protein